MAQTITIHLIKRSDNSSYARLLLETCLSMFPDTWDKSFKKGGFVSLTYINIAVEYK